MYSTNRNDTSSQRLLELISSQEETDTLITMYCMYAKQKGYQKFCIRVCYKIENYVGRTFLNSKPCKKLVALLIAYPTWTETRTRIIFCKKGDFLRIWICNISLLPKQWVSWKDTDKFLFDFKITAYHDFVSEFNFQLIEWVFS